MSANPLFFTAVIRIRGIGCDGAGGVELVPEYQEKHWTWLGSFISIFVRHVISPCSLLLEGMRTAMDAQSRP
jgi:hypothetical protein